MELKEKLAALRKEKGLSQIELAAELHVSRQAISRWEVGKAVPSTDNLIWLSRFYGVSMDELMGAAIDGGQKIHEEEPAADAKKASIKKGKRSVGPVLIAIGIFAAIFCTILFRPKGEGPVSMDNIEGSEIVTVNDFDLEW